MIRKEAPITNAAGETVGALTLVDQGADYLTLTLHISVPRRNCEEVYQAVEALALQLPDDKL